MPRQWADTVEVHRRELYGAILNAAAALAAENGLRSVNMSRIAEHLGISRPTVYKYFPDTEAILAAWYERQLTSHLTRLTETAAQPGLPCQRVEAVLADCALAEYQLRLARLTELVAYLKGSGHVSEVEPQLHELIRRVLAVGAQAGQIRTDVDPSELATYCLYAVAAAASLSSEAAVRRLATVTLTGLRPALTAAG